MSTRRQHDDLPGHLPRHLHAEHEPGPAGEIRLRIDLLGFERATRLLREAGARFITLFLGGMPEPSLVAAFALRGELIVLRAPTGSHDPVVYGSIGAGWPAADGPSRSSSSAGASNRSATPQHAGSRIRMRIGWTAPERPGCFQLAVRPGALWSLRGDPVPDRDRRRGRSASGTRPFFKHRGIEARFSGLDPNTAVHVAERVAGIASVAYACAFCQAVERALGVSPPPSAERWRAVHAELERIACHLDVIAKEAETTALFVGQCAVSDPQGGGDAPAQPASPAAASAGA